MLLVGILLWICVSIMLAVTSAAQGGPILLLLLSSLGVVVPIFVLLPLLAVYTFVQFRKLYSTKEVKRYVEWLNDHD